MSVRVAIPGIWRGLTDGAPLVECHGTTVLAVLQDLGRRHPGMYDRLFAPGGAPKGFVQVFLNGRGVKDWTAPVALGDELLLLVAIAGG